MLKSITNIFKIEELRKKIAITLSLLIVYRAGCFIPTAGVDTAALNRFFETMAETQGQTLLGMVNLFTGGALQQLSIFALGVMPYVSASIIMQILTSIIPALERLAKEGKAGYEKINQYTRYFTFVLCGIQGLFLSLWLSNPNNFRGIPIVLDTGILFTFTTIVTLTAGTIFVMWLGEQIQQRGIGNGISMIIAAGIIAGIPSSLRQLWILYSPFDLAKRQISTPTIITLVAIWFLTIAAIVLFAQAQRRIPIQYGKRIIGRRVYGGATQYLPIKVDMSGVIAIIFASSVLAIPATISMFLPRTVGLFSFIQRIFQEAGFWYNFIYVSLIIFFMYFYTAMIFNPLELSNNLKRNGGFIPGIRPGSPTVNYIDFVTTRIVFVGAMYVAVIAIFPHLIMRIFRVPSYGLASLFGGTTLLIMVGVLLDTMKQIEGQLLIRHYDGFIKGGTLKGRR